MNKRAGQVAVHVEHLEDAPEAVAATHRVRRGEKADSPFLSMRLLGKDRERLKGIVAQMLELEETDLEEGESISIAGAARYAFRRCLEKA